MGRQVSKSHAHRIENPAEVGSRYCLVVPCWVHIRTTAILHQLAVWHGSPEREQQPGHIDPASEAETRCEHSDLLKSGDLGIRVGQSRQEEFLHPRPRQRDLWRILQFVERPHFSGEPSRHHAFVLRWRTPKDPVDQKHHISHTIAIPPSFYTIPTL